MCETGLMPLGDSRGSFCYNVDVQNLEVLPVQPCISTCRPKQERVLWHLARTRAEQVEPSTRGTSPMTELWAACVRNATRAAFPEQRLRNRLERHGLRTVFCAKVTGQSRYPARSRAFRATVSDVMRWADWYHWPMYRKPGTPETGRVTTIWPRQMPGSRWMSALSKL